ncbi:MAG: ABC transporter ATP-binding protein [Halomonas sp.]
MADCADLRAERLSLGYDERTVMTGLDLAIPAHKVTAIVGPNACGKSTLLRALARLLRPRQGAVLLDGKPLHQIPTRRLAQRLGLLPQAPNAPEGLTVEDLVSRGRFPHQRLFDYWSPEDEQAVDEALKQTALSALRQQRLDALSGGQRQRAWIAMALAQQTDLLLLDEPTTFLDIAHRLEVLELLRRLNRERQCTVVMVVHELNEAVRYADHLVAMRDGAIVAEGPPAEVVTADLVERVFGIVSRIIPDPVTGLPLVVPEASQEAPPTLRRA